MLISDDESTIKWIVERLIRQKISFHHIYSNQDGHRLNIQPGYEKEAQSIIDIHKSFVELQQSDENRY